MAGCVLLGVPIAMPKLKECMTDRMTAVSTAPVTGAFWPMLTGMPSSSFLDEDAAKLALDNALLTSVELSILSVTCAADMELQ
jgi:hypothetical protein